MEITPSEALNAGLVLAGEYAEGVRTPTHISPKYARYGCPCLAFFYGDDNGGFGVTLRSPGSVTEESSRVSSAVMGTFSIAQPLGARTRQSSRIAWRSAEAPVNAR